MYKLTNLSPSDKARVTSTVERLNLQVSEALTWEVMPIQGCHDSALLEIAVNGRYAKPIRLFETSEGPADTICRELTNFASSYTNNAKIAKVYCGANPKYNGQHHCPRCNAPSFWSCIDSETATVRIECSEACGIYQQRYSELATLPFSGISEHLAA